MAAITKNADPSPKDDTTGIQHGVPSGAADEESHGGYGGTDRLQTEAAPLQPASGTNEDVTKDVGKDI